MNTNYYLRLDGIKGSSKAKFHPGEIEVLTYSLGPFSSNILARGGGGAAGRTNISELSFTNKIDLASIMLRDFCTQGRRIAKGKLTAESVLPGGKINQILSLEMEDIMVSNFIFYGDSEMVTLIFDKFKYNS